MDYQESQSIVLSESRSYRAYRDDVLAEARRREIEKLMVQIHYGEWCYFDQIDGAEFPKVFYARIMAGENSEFYEIALREAAIEVYSTTN